MGDMTVLAALAVVAAIIAYVTFQVDGEEHGLLQGLFIFILLSMVVLVGKAGLDGSDTCNVVVRNTTDSGNYQYDRVCFDNTDGTADTFYTVTLWIWRLASLYIVLYLIYQFLWYGVEVVR